MNLQILSEENRRQDWFINLNFFNDNKSFLLVRFPRLIAVNELTDELTDLSSLLCALAGKDQFTFVRDETERHLAPSDFQTAALFSGKTVLFKSR